MKKIRFKVNGRTASLLSEKYLSEVQDAFAFSVPSARYTWKHKQWLKEKALGIPEEERTGWNGKTSLMKDGKVSIGLLKGAKTELEKKGLYLIIEDWKNKPAVNLIEGFWEKDKAYDYQNTCVHNMLDCIPDGGGLVLSATGTGKTKIAAQFFSHLSGNCLFVVNRLNLLYQSQKEIGMWLEQQGFDKKVGVVGNGEFKPERITIATIQTLHAHRNKTKFREWLGEIDIVLIDELHKQMSRSNFGVIDLVKPQAVIGLTATMQLKKKPIRFRCYSICGPSVFEFPMVEAVHAGVVSQGVVVQTPISPNLEPRRFKIIDNEKIYEDDYMHEVVRNKNAHRFVTQMVKDCISQNLCIVVLVERIKHLKWLNARLKKQDLEPQLFFGEINVKTRRKQLVAFDKGRADIILANQVFTEGINVKRIDAVLDCAQRGNRDAPIQKMGRAVRLHAEKAGILYIDIFTQIKKFEKAAKARKGAFKQNKIPIVVLDKITIPAEVLKIADKLLTDTLKKNKDKSAQGKLF